MQIGNPSRSFLVNQFIVFGVICLENRLNYEKVVFEEKSELVGYFNYVICARNWPEPSRNWQLLAESHWTTIQLLRYKDRPRICCTGHLWPSSWYRRRLRSGRDRMSIRRNEVVKHGETEDVRQKMRKAA